MDTFRNDDDDDDDDICLPIGPFQSRCALSRVTPYPFSASEAALLFVHSSISS